LLNIVFEATTSTNPHSGRHALFLRNPAWPHSDGRLTQQVTGVPGGASYRAAIFARSPDGDHDVNIKLEVYGSDGKYLGGFRSEHFTVAANAGWVQIEYTHKLPPDPNLRVSVLYRMWGAGPILLDDASFCLVEQEPLYLPADAQGERLLQTHDLLAWTAPLPTRIPADYPLDPAKAQRWAA
jgi:hypothetical protein